ncbi:hypothetical protein NDU88_007501 [Pleurodeles waltl]|uniref:Uncharacterized protein n=1 Tax=Pleurodeles waltl TaxID=8319 RepID=A0AAV7P2C6_PLEWA|nr:hypothetical protein NDU88_007501 [Pleurodeles waltl]
MARRSCVEADRSLDHRISIPLTPASDPKGRFQEWQQWQRWEASYSKSPAGHGRQTYSPGPKLLDDLSVNPAGYENDVTKSEVTPPSLGLIYETIMAQHKQTQGDSKKARVATKQLQVAASKIAKSCSEIGERIATIEARADVLETDLGAVVQQAAMHDNQLSDIQWKIEDFEICQHRNNLHILGIQERQDARAYIIRLLKAAFPEQSG